MLKRICSQEVSWGFGWTNLSEHIRAVQPNRKRHWNQLVAMLDSSNSNGSEGSQVSLGWRPNGDGAANGSSTIVHRVLIDFSRQGGWRPEHRGRSREAIEMFDHDREVPSIDWRVHLVVPQQVPADVRIRKCDVELRKDLWRRHVPRGW